MQITKDFLTQLRNRLKTGNRGTAYLDATTTNGKQKIDVNELKGIDNNLPNSFLIWLLSGTTPTFIIPNSKDILSTQAINTIENLITKSTGIELERGINTLAFGYPILVRKDNKDGKLVAAPLLLWSLRIKRSNNSWKVIRREYDLIYPNEVLQNHLLADSTIDLKEITQNFLNQEDITRELLEDYCKAILRKFNANLGGNSENLVPLNLIDYSPNVTKEVLTEEIGVDPKARIYNSGIFSLFEVQKQSVIEDYESLLKLEKLTFEFGDWENLSFQSLSSVETDPSQQGVLNTMKLQKNILIQGPPGTGKSQTLRAILVNALENGKRTVVVCEKRTALEVLQSGLTNMNLDDLCVLIKDTKSDRKETIKKARNKIDNLKNIPRINTTKIALEQYNKELQKLIDTINERHKKIGKPLLEDQDWTEVVGLLLQEKRKGSIKGKRPFPVSIFSFENGELGEYLYFLNNAEPIFEKYFSLQPHSVWNPEKLISANPFAIQTEIKADVTYYLQEAKFLTEEIENFKETYFELRLKEFNKDVLPIKDGIRRLKEVIQRNSSNDAFFDRNKTRKWYYQFGAIIIKSYENTITDQNHLRELFTWLYGKLIQSDFFGNFPFNPSIKENLEFLEGLESEVTEKEKNSYAIIREEIDGLDFIKDTIKYTPDNYHSFLERYELLRERMAKNQWLIQEEPIPNDERISNYCQKLALIFSEKIENEPAFYAAYEWYNFWHQATPNQKRIIDVIKYTTNWKQTFTVNYLDALLQKNATNELPRNNEDWGKLSNLLENKGRRQVKYIKKLWASKQHQAITQFNQTNQGLAAKNLYNHRKGTIHKRYSLRFITSYDANLFTTIFPIILTTPTACSHLFQDKRDFFDIVLFDEASQLQLPDTFPALLKGKQCIIAGDKHQMPPSNLFQKSMVETERTFDSFDKNIGSNLKEDLLLKSESLLDFAETMGFEEVNLDFHYRSQHPYLIDFSNHAFYEKRLIPQPKVEDYKPIVFIHLADAIYKNRVNEAEAEMVLSILKNNIHQYPDGTYPTVGIATINEDQQKLIAKKINDAKNDDPQSEFANKLNQLENNPDGALFVKNLERLQGDERDALIISTNYGKNEEGKFSRNFSLLNRETGYRRLNVLITRAKCKIYLCTSIPEKEFMNYRAELKTYGNNKRAILYAYIAYAKAVSEAKDNKSRESILNALLGDDLFEHTKENNNSTFKQEVYQKLVEKYGAEKVKMDVPFAGYTLDILFDSTNKMVIDCDGTIYHESEEAYLFDYHRERKLSAYGYFFHRIWSTNWWRDAEKEFKQLCQLIEIYNEKEVKLDTKIKMATAFKDEIFELIKENQSINL